MKKIISIMLACAMLITFAPAVMSADDGVAFAPDGNAPVSVVDDTVVLKSSVSAAELLSFFKNKDELTLSDAEGNALSGEDSVVGGTKIANGDDVLTVAVYGDANNDGKINARDIISMLRAVSGDDSAVNGTVADIDASGSINAKDITAVMKKLVGYSVPVGEDAALDAGGSEAISIYFDSLMHRVGRSDTTIYGDSTGLIRMAKNELEDAQMFIVSKTALKDVTLEIGEMKNDNGDTLSVTPLEEYAWKQTIFKKLVTKDIQAPENQVSDYFGEALPKLAAPFALGANESKAFAIQVKTTADTVAGYYSAPITVKDSEGNVLKETVLRVLVWDIVLDERPASDTAFGFSWSDTVVQKYKGDPDAYAQNVHAVYEQVYRDYEEFFLENHISTYTLPFDVLDNRADEFMSDPRLTTFCTLGGGQFSGDPYKANGNADEYIRSVYAKLNGHEDWLEKAYVYLLDEPFNNAVKLSKNVYDFLERNIPEYDYHVVVPMAGNGSIDFEDGTLMDYVEYTTHYTDIMCPQSYCFTPFYTKEERRKANSAGIELFPPGSYIDTWTNSEIYKRFGNKQFQQRYDEYVEQGQEAWWYICCSPMMPHPNYFKYYEGAAQRITLWQQYMFHSNGLLYWAMQYTWNSINLKRNDASDGDGLLMYWGELFGQTGAVSSIRLEYIRDGIEDFQYMKQLERLGTDRDEIIKKYVNQLTTEVLRYTENPYDIEDVRVALGFALEEASRPQ